MGRIEKFKFVFCVIGILITIIGWFLSNANRFQIVLNVLAPKYVRANFALTKLKEKGASIKQGDKGFEELVTYFVEQKNPGYPVPDIIKIESEGTYKFSGTKPDRQWHTGIKLTFYATNFAPLTIKKHDLDKKIGQRYLGSKLNIYGDFIFWIGIIFLVLPLLIDFKNTWNKHVC